MFLPADTGGQLTLYDGDYSEVKLMHSMVEQLVEDKTDLEVDVYKRQAYLPPRLEIMS